MAISLSTSDLRKAELKDICFGAENSVAVCRFSYVNANESFCKA